MSGFTKGELLKFLDTMISKGWVNSNTGNSWRAAVKKILGDLPDDTDVREVDLKVELLRYNNLNPGQLAPDSLRVYEQRASVGIQQFINYKTDPQNYKPPSRGLPGSKVEKADRKSINVKTQTADSKLAASRTEQPPVEIEHQQHGRPISGTATETNLALPFPLRPNYLAQIVIPRDLTKEEADRLCVFIQALAQTK